MKSQNMTEAAKEKRREYYRHYRAQNKERIKEHNRRYWEKKAAEAAEKLEAANAARAAAAEGGKE